MKDCVELVLTKGEFAIPKFFFHCSCTTTVKLITSPSQSQLHSHNITPSGGCGSLGSDPLVVFAGENLTLRTEGVVTQTRKRKERRPDSKLSVNKCYVHYSLMLVIKAFNFYEFKNAIYPESSHLSLWVLI